MYLIKQRTGQYYDVRKEVPEEAEPDDILVIPPAYHHLFADQEDLRIEDRGFYAGGHGDTVSVELVTELMHNDHFSNLEKNVAFYGDVITAMQEIFGHEAFFMYGQFLCACTVNTRIDGERYGVRRLEGPRIYQLRKEPWFHFIMSPREERTAVEIFDELYDLHIRQALEGLDTNDRDAVRVHVAFPEEPGKGVRFIQEYRCDYDKEIGANKSIQVVEEATGAKRARVFPEGRGYMTKNYHVYMYARPDFALKFDVDVERGNYSSTPRQDFAAVFLTGSIVPEDEVVAVWRLTRSRISRALSAKNPSKSVRLRPNVYAKQAEVFHHLIRNEHFVYFRVNSGYCGGGSPAVLNLSRGVKVDKAPTTYLYKVPVLTYLKSNILPGMRAAAEVLDKTAKALAREFIFERFYELVDEVQQKHPSMSFEADFQYWLLDANRSKTLFKMFEPEFIPVKEQKCEKVKKCIDQCRKAYESMTTEAANLLTYWLDFLLDRYPGNGKIALQRTDDVWDQLFFHYYNEEGESDSTKIFNKLLPEHQELLMSRAERKKEKIQGTKVALEFLKKQKEEEACSCSSPTGGEA